MYAKYSERLVSVDVRLPCAPLVVERDEGVNASRWDGLGLLASAGWRLSTWHDVEDARWLERVQAESLAIALQALASGCLRR